MATTRSPGRPPEFVGGFSRTRHWLKVSRAEYLKLTKQAELRGLTYREFVRRRLREALAEYLTKEE